MAGVAKEFVICLDNQGYEASLIVGKVYPKIPDPEAERRGWVRIVDEDRDERDGYLYPAHLFWPIELPVEVRRVLWAGV